MRFRVVAVVVSLAYVVQWGGSAGADAPCAANAHTGGDWASYGHDLENTRNQPGEHVITPALAGSLEPAWVFSAAGVGADGGFTGTPVVVDGCLYVGNDAGWVFVLDADTGAPVWKTQIGAGIPSSIAVDAGRVYANGNRTGTPFTVALDRHTGEHLWETVVDDTGTDTTLYSSPVLFDGMVIVGVSAANAGRTGPATSGKIVFLDAATGEVVKKTYTIPPELWPDGYGAAGVWSTPAVDASTGYAYVGAGNPNLPDRRHAHNNAVLKFDADPSRATFGEIVGSFRNNPYEQLPGGAQHPDPHFEHYDFGASPVIYTAPGGRRMVSILQGSGVHHGIDAETMQPVWLSVVGPISPAGNASSPGFDGTSVLGAANGSVLYALDPQTGAIRWAMPAADAVARYQPVASANGVVYTVDLSESFLAFDAATGMPLLRRPLPIDTANASIGLGAVSVARNTVYVDVGLAVNGYVIAYRPPAG